MSDDANPFSFFKEGGSVGSVGSGTDESKSRKKGKRRKRKSKTDGSGGGGGASDDFVVSPVVGDFEVGLNPFSFFVETKAGAVKKKEKKKKAKGKDNRRASAGDDFDLPPPPPPLHPADKEPASLFGSAPAPAPVNRQRAQTAATGVPPVNARPTVSTPSVVETTTAHVKRVVDAPPPPVFGGSGSGSGSYDGGSGSYSSSSYSDNSGEGSPNATPTAASTGAATTVLPPVGAQAKANGGSSGGGGGGVPVESNGDSTSHARLKEDLRRVKADYEDAIYRSVSAERDLEAANKKIRVLEAQVVRLKAGGVASPRATRNIFGSDDEAEDASLSMDGSLGPPLPSSSGLDSPTSFLNSSQGAQILELQDEVKRLRAREAEDNRVLNEYMDKVEGKISAANRRTADANAKAKALEAEVVGLRMMLQDAHGTGMFASEKLMKLAEVGETNIRQMVAGLEHLKHAANALMAFDRVTTIPDRPNGDDDDSDASDGAS